MKITKQNSLSLLFTQNLHVTFSERITLIILSEFSPDLFYLTVHIFGRMGKCILKHNIYMGRESVCPVGHCIHTLKTVLAHSIHSINSG